MGSVTSTSALAAQAKSIHALAAQVPSSAVLPWISLKYYERATIYIAVHNATTVTGSAVTLSQATDTAGSDSKALAFANMYANEDTANQDYQTLTTVASNTFTTDSTNDAELLYQIEIDADDLDTANDFNALKVNIGDATAATISVIVVLWPPITAGVIPSAIVD